MKFKQIVPGLSAMVVAAAFSLPAHAGLVVLDGIQIDTNGNLTTNIGRINLVSGNSTVHQEVNGSNNVFVGARFVEDGQIFSISYTTENTVGPLDSGAPGIFTDGLTLRFNNVAGHVDQLLSGGGFHFVFTSGVYSISSASGATVTGSIVGVDGTSSSSSTVSGATGATTLLGTVLPGLGLFDFRDSTGASLAAELAAGTVLFEATTNNQTTAASSFGACSFDATANCATATTASAGDSYLVRRVPEPGTLAIVGLALGILGFVGRRRKQG